jgi:DNA-binding winged helix-turn-helix (wHTH) protein
MRAASGSVLGEAGDKGALATTDIFLFEEFRLDRQGEGLSRRNERGVFVPMPIGLRALDVLGVLVERSGDLVTKEQIMAAVWGQAVVESANLTVQISGLRRVLDGGRAEGSCIQTVAARGYRFVAPVTRVGGLTPDVSGDRAARDDTRVTRDHTTAFAAEYASQAKTTVNLRAPSMSPAVLQRRHNALAAIAATAAAALAVTAIVWWVWLAPTSSPAPGARAPVAWSASAPRLSIVVLPFRNLGDDPDQQYLPTGSART